MPIVVACQCGQRFQAKDELAGRTVKCPKCSSPLTIGAPSAAKGRVPQAVPAAAQAGAALFDQAGLKARGADEFPCPSCGAAMRMGTVVCLSCGYHVTAQKKLQTHKPATIGGGHGVTAEDLLEKAADAIEEDRIAKEAKFKEGMPTWVYGFLLVAMVSLTLVLLLNQPHVSIHITGVCMIVVASIMGFYFTIRLLMILFSDRNAFKDFGRLSGPLLLIGLAIVIGAVGYGCIRIAPALIPTTG